MTHHAHFTAVRAALLLSTLALLIVASPGGAQTTTDGTLAVNVIVSSGLDQPTSMAFLALNDFLVLEKATGRVRRVVNNVVQAGFALDLNVNSDSERGLLGIAIDQGSTPVHVFLYFTEASGADGGTALANRVRRYDWNPGAGSGSLTNPQVVLDLPVTPGPNHDGGNLILDSQGRLYVIIGELNRNGQLQNNSGGAAPDDTGVILRVNQDGTAATGNPFTPYCSTTTATTCSSDANCPVGQTCRTQVARYFAYGIRNSFGIAFDPATGRLWQTENGPDVMDELNQVDAGMNSGWNQIMGPDALDPQGTADLFNMPGAGLTYSDPEFSWVDTIAVTGLVFPHATTWGAAYNNRVLVGDSNLGNIYVLPLNVARTGLDTTALPASVQDLVAQDQTEANLVRLGQGFGAVTDLEKGPDDNIYVVDIGGRIIRISGPAPVSLQEFRID